MYLYRLPPTGSASMAAVLYSQNGIVQKDEEKVLNPEEIITMNWLAENVIGTLPERKELMEKAKPLINVQGLNENREEDA